MIKKSEWATPDKVKSIKLKDSDGMKCCLGFVCEQLGYTDIADLFLVEDVARNVGEHLENFTSDSIYHCGTIVDSEFSTSCVYINDDEEITNAERQKQLKKIFKENGHKLRFI